MQPTIFKSSNPITKKYEVIDPDLTELVPGQTMLKLFWCPLASRYVTVPGASLFVVTDDLSLALVLE